MSVCGSCEREIHHTGRMRVISQGKECECKCVAMPRPGKNLQRQKSKLAKIAASSEPVDMGSIGEISVELNEMRKRIAQLGAIVSAIPPPTPAHQCTISHEFALKLIGKLDDLGNRVACIEASVATKTRVIATLASVEKDALAHALTVCDGDAEKTAVALGINRATVYNLAKRYNIDLRGIKFLARDKAREAKLDVG